MLGLGNSISHASPIRLTPTDVSGLMVWLQNGVGITSSGSPAVIDVWADSSGNGNDATTTGGTRPYLVDGGGEWEGDSDADTLALDSELTLAQFHIFVVVAADETSTNTIVAGNSTQDFIRIGQSANNKAHRMKANGAATTPADYIATTAVATDGTKQLLEYELSSGSSNNSFLRINGSLEATVSHDGSSNALDIGFVGATNSSGGSSFNGKIYEVLIYNTALSSSQASDIRSHINDRLNIY